LTALPANAELVSRCSFVGWSTSVYTRLAALTKSCDRSQPAGTGAGLATHGTVKRVLNVEIFAGLLAAGTGRIPASFLLI
jgi:hypothetical protein